jgi:hypothetical protein
VYRHRERNKITYLEAILTNIERKTNHKKVFAVHAEPPLAENEEWEVLWDPYSGQIFYNNKRTGSSMYRFNPILHMWFREVVLHVMVLLPNRFPLLFKMGYLIIIKRSFKCLW